MGWLGSWLQNSIGTWLGSGEPEAPGAMRATLAGSSAMSGTLEGEGVPPVQPPTPEVFVYAGYGTYGKPKLTQDEAPDFTQIDNDIVDFIIAFTVNHL